MKGIILAGGSGIRLRPMTRVTNKHLFPVYDKPMIYYPLMTLLKANIKNILIVAGLEHAGDFIKLLGSGKEFKAKFTYKVQDEAGGIAQALSLAEDFVGMDNCVVVLGDNIMEENIKERITVFEKSGKEAAVFLKKVNDPSRYGIAEINEKINMVTNIDEKSSKPKTNLAVIGTYLYTPFVFDVIRRIIPSKRGELEITDVNNEFIRRKSLMYFKVKGLWMDAGTKDSLIKASEMVKANPEKFKMRISSALMRQKISSDQVMLR